MSEDTKCSLKIFVRPRPVSCPSDAGRGDRARIHAPCLKVQRTPICFRSKGNDLRDESTPLARECHAIRPAPRPTHGWEGAHPLPSPVTIAGRFDGHGGRYFFWENESLV